MLVAARDAGVKRFVYANQFLRLRGPSGIAQEGGEYRPPAVSLRRHQAFYQIYADVFQRCYGLPTVGLRYFNVFGPRQDPQRSLRGGDSPVVRRPCRGNARPYKWRWKNQPRLLLYRQHRAGESARGGRAPRRGIGRDLQHRVRAAHGVDPALRQNPRPGGRAPGGGRRRGGDAAGTGGRRDSLADTARARTRLGYEPTHSIDEGLSEACGWYLRPAQASG